MPTMTVTRHARAPIERVFRHATNLREAPKFVPAIRALEVLTEGPVRLGTRFRETRVVFGREATEEMEVVAFDPPLSYSIGCDNHGCRYRTDFTFRQQDGGTRLEMTFTAEALTWTAKVMGTLMKPLLKKMVGECAKDLDAIVAAAEKG